MTGDDILLGVTNLDGSYGPVRAVRGVSLTVPREAIVTILGSNGAGKSTVLKAISGTLLPDRGRVSFRGADITGQDPARIVRAGLVHVPEGREVFPLLSIHENLLMGSYTRADRDAVAGDMERVFDYFPVLRERRKQAAGLLSGGQQQMLAIGRALIARPAMILLDEPSLGLSPRLTREIFEIIVRINRENGTTILLVEQNSKLALNVADFGYVMEHGRVVLEGQCAVLREKDDIAEFYLGRKDDGVRGARRWKKKKNWR